MKSFPFQWVLSPARLWQRLRHLHIENKGLKLTALALAILLFAVSRQPISDVKLFNVPLEYRGLSPGVEISGDVEQTVSLRVRGARDLVRSLSPSQLSVIADLTSKEPGERVVQLRPNDVSLPDNSIQVIQIEPASIRLVLEPKLKKSVTVEAQFMGQLAEGLEIYRTSVEPPTIEIEGPQSQLNKVSHVLTETVNLSGRNKDFRTTVDVETPQRSLRVLTPSPIKLSIEIGERRSFKRLSGISIGLPAHLSESSPEPVTAARLPIKTIEVEFYGPHSAVEALRAKDLSAEVKTINWLDGVGVAELSVSLPETADKRIEVRNIIPKEVKLKK